MRNVNQGRPQQLSDEILAKYDLQIKYLDSFGESGAYLFQSYRQAKVLAIGSGPFLLSLVAAMFQSGLSNFHVFITDSESTDRQRLMELTEHARISDPEAAVNEITPLKKGVSSWKEVVQPFHWILYVSQEGNVEELRALHAVCRAEKKVLLPAMCIQQTGLAGPLVHPDADGCWESAWRRIHVSALHKDPMFHTFSSTAGAMLANVIVFDLLKTVTGVTESELKHTCFLLDLQTLEGSYHSFMPHPLVTGRITAEQVQDFEKMLGKSTDSGELNGLFSCFNQLTSPESGIFHLWDEGDLKQLPLSQCRVQAADPLSEGPAELLPTIIRTGLTHQEARREAGLAGIEAYVSRMADLCVPKLASDQGSKKSMAEPLEFIGIGAGETVEEAVCRGLQNCLTEQLKRQISDRKPAVIGVRLGKVEDVRCRFYLQALTTMQGAPEIGSGEDLLGFPVMWIGINDRWYGCVGLNRTMALRMALQQALIKMEKNTVSTTTQGLEIPALDPEEKISLNLEIQASEDTAQVQLLQSALQVLKRNHKRLLVFDMALEPFLKEEMGGLFGVLLRKEESR